MSKSCLAVCFASFFATVAYSQTVVIPNANAAATGNTVGPLQASPISAERQIVLNASQFPSGTIAISGFAFRAAPNVGAASFNMTGSIFASYSPNTASSTPGPLLSTTLANNVGSNRTLVFSGSATISAPACTGAGPCGSGNNIVFSTSFPYNPAVGPLLLDLQLTSFNIPGPGGFDEVACPVASCVANSAFGLPFPGSGTGTVTDVNNVLQLTYSTVSATPVPSSILITLLGLACVGLYFGRRGSKLA